MVCRLTSFPFGVPLLCATLIGLAGCSVDAIVLLPGFEDPTEAFGDEGEEGEEGEEGASQGHAIPAPPNHADPFGLACSVPSDGIDAALPCDAAPPSDTFDPVIAWTWTGPDGEDSVLVTPLVANLDDDNDDDLTDLCDHPELVVLAVNLPAVDGRPVPAGHIYLLDSATGETKLRIDHPVDATATPAIADLDDDGNPEILAFERSEELDGSVGMRRVVAFSASGERVWSGEQWSVNGGGGGLAVADLDADGSPEILTPDHVLDADGSFAWAPSTVDAPPSDALPIAADLDLDGQLEVLYGRSIYLADGSFELELELPGASNSGVAAIANFDDDPYPEIYVQSVNHRFFDHDGARLANCGGGGSKGLPVSIADVDGDGQAELLTQHGGSFTAKSLELVDGELDCVSLWEPVEIDGSVAAGAAFDFLADGSAEAIYPDLHAVRIYGSDGVPVAEIEREARASSTATPVVADADNDGAAELVVVSSEPIGGDGLVSRRASVMLIQNHDDRFAPTRRIWNQHAYHATNIREDGSVPVVQARHWQSETSNSFRSNPAPAYDGELCQSPAFE